ncbi:MAG TPA: hypothetical protein PLO62_07850 [Candidatus Hydrogenedentes bacterium]|nr:hypothetical protein [Candidatus Hydrogenedentota bacterium]HOS02723.1 hypothetical protein [Candidatus Hydrogenedentota bacterium]
MLLRGDGSVTTLRDANIASLSPSYRNVAMSASGGNRIGQIAFYTRSDGSEGLAVDSILKFLA